MKIFIAILTPVTYFAGFAVGNLMAKVFVLQNTELTILVSIVGVVYIMQVIYFIISKERIY